MAAAVYRLLAGTPQVAFPYRSWGSRGKNTGVIHHSFLQSNDGRVSLVAQMVKSLPALWETQVCSLGWEDPLEKGMATHFSIEEYWRIPGAEEPGRL